MEMKFEKLITLGCLGTLELVPLGCFGILDGWWCLGAQSLWCKAPGKRRGLQLGCGDRLEQFDGFGDRPQGLPFVRVR